jgi:trimethylamine--corrinoid protein Co-methyltransferase
MNIMSVFPYPSMGAKEGRTGIKSGQLELLTKEQIEEIDNAAKEILWRTGVHMPHEEAMELMKKAGCVVDKKEKMVWIPPYLVDEAVRKTPKGFKSAGRDPKNAIMLDKKRVYFVGGVGPYVVAPDGTMSKPTLKDQQNCYRVIDACKNIDVTSTGVFGGPTTPEEDMTLPLSVRRIRGYFRMLELTEKPIDMSKRYVVDREAEETDERQASLDLINFEIACRGSLEELQKLPMSFAMNEPASPLMHAPKQIDRMLVYCRHGLPTFIGSGPMTNATGPATLAGTLALWNAETLSCLVLGVIAADPKHIPPTMWMTFYGPFDQMAAQGPIQGSPEAALVQAASAQIAHYYGFPIRGIIGSPSKALDAQAGYETALTLLISALGGVNYNVSFGVVGPGEIGMSLEKIVLDDEVAGYIKRVMQGIEVSDETLAVDVIDEVGPGGTFLAHPHTRKWFRKEQYFPSIFDRRKFEDWVRHGRKDAVQRATERVQEILKEYWPEPLDPDIRKNLENYVKQVEKREAKRV